MRISMFRFYKISIVLFVILGFSIIIGSAIFTAYYSIGDSIDNYVMLILGVPVGLIIAVFPLSIYHRQLTRISIDDCRCVSYSILQKKLCSVSFDQTVYYSIFYVTFLYAKQVRFIALSNEPFTCELHHTNLNRKSFFGTYDTSKIVVLPYDETTIPLLRVYEWHCVGQSDRLT